VEKTGLVSADRTPPDIYNRVIAALKGEKPDRLPFIDRMELWYSSHSRLGTLPEEFRHCAGDRSPSIMSTFAVPVPPQLDVMRLTDIHRIIGFGQQYQTIAHARRLRGVELVLKLDSEIYLHEQDPVVDYFPRLFNMLQLDRPGETQAEFITPVGKLTTRSKLAPEMIETGAIPIMYEYPLKTPGDVAILEYIYERAEFVPRFAEIHDIQSRLGRIGFVVPMLDRIPFQKICLDLFGEVDFFYMLNDEPELIDRLFGLLDQVMQADIREVSEFDWSYIQFDDNLDGMITNPRLFQKYCLGAYQAYVELLHAQGKKVGSHTDGNLKRLVGVLPETGLDVFESFSPQPLTDLSFEDGWNAWQGKGPMIWGGIPSSLLQPDVPEERLYRFLDRMLELVGGQPIILGIGDMVMSNNLIERVRTIAERVESYTIPN
jgi:Uroporphyrinogen decarboxylase (URO-D)